MFECILILSVFLYNTVIGVWICRKFKHPIDFYPKEKK